MKFDQIYLDIIEIIEIIDFQLVQMTDEHCEANYSAYIDSSKVKEYCDLSKRISNAKIFGITENKDKILIMDGYIKDFQVLSMREGYYVKIVLKSHTYEMDLVKNIVPYQDASQTMKEIVEITMGKYPGYECSFLEKPGKCVDQFLVQYQETDWEFCKRIASQVNAKILPTVISEGPGITIGIPNSGRYQAMDYDELAYLWEDDQDGIQIKTREFYELGSQVQCDGDTYYVFKSTLAYVKGRFMNEYILKRKEAFSRKEYYNMKVIGASLEGTVMEVLADQVKVNLMGEKVCRLFDYATIYSSPDGTGWYCMPEIGDRVRVYFPSSEEKEAYVISSTHESTESGARTNPDEKSIKNKFGKEILLTPESILITNNAGMYIELNDNNGISIVSNKKISITSEQDVGIFSTNSSINMVGSEQVMLAQDESKIILKSDITMEAERVLTV